jgi:hypothetical protein
MKWGNRMDCGSQFCFGVSREMKNPDSRRALVRSKKI